MKSIEHVEINRTGIKRDDSLSIKHVDGKYGVSSFIDKSNAALNFDDLSLSFPKGGYSRFSAYSKAQLIESQIVLLHAFVFSHDKLELAIKEAKSKSTLDELKSNIFIIRKILMSLTNYIDSYDEMLKEYKEV